ncbi:hypothetical protein WS73_09605 [Burkholderia savannae]|nr:hypothetical protein WS73_09605 [Burkholderia savannae]
MKNLPRAAGGAMPRAPPAGESGESDESVRSGGSTGRADRVHANRIIVPDGAARRFARIGARTGGAGWAGGERVRHANAG